MVRTRKAIYVGNQEVQRRYIGNKLIFELLGEMDDRVKVSGTEIFTDRADNSVVHVEVDGKSYQDGVPTPDYPIEIHSVNDFDVVSSTEKLSEGQLEEYNYNVEYENVHKINLLLDEPLRSVGNVKDRLFRDNDGLWKIERNIGEIVVDGSENWVKASIHYVNRFDLSNFLDSNLDTGINETEFLNTHFKPLAENINDNVTWISGTSFRIIHTDIDSADSLKSWLSSEYNNGTPVKWIKLYDYSTTETLDQELQDKLNNLSSFQDSNYVYTVINDILPTVAENLKPTLHATFKSKGWYDDYQDTLLK